MPLMVFIQRTISFSPSEITKEEQKTLTSHNWKLKDINNNTVDFSQSKGNVVLINFWATWCPPCVAEMPELQALYDSYGSAVDFYFVTNDTPKKVKQFLQKNSYTFPVYFEQTSAPENLQTNALPTTYLISKKGTIVIQKTGSAKWNSKRVHQTITRLLQE